MSVFPKLKTGVVAQYPVMREATFSTVVSRFVDSSEQRFRDYRGLRRRWVVNLSQLDETEIRQLTSFFLEQQGRFGSFDFEDPWSGGLISGCRFEDDRMVVTSDGEFDGRVGIVIVGPAA